MANSDPSAFISMTPEEKMQIEPGINVLLVDDHPQNLLSLEAILGDMNLNLVKATSGQEALRWVLRQDFALILLDVRLPDIDGFEVAQLIRDRERSRHIPIIFLTAYAASDEQILRGYSVGGVDFTLKPFIPEILRYKVEVFVDLFQKTEALRRLNETLEQQVAKRTAELQRAEEKYRSLFQHAVEGIFQTTLDGRYLIVANPAMARILGYETPEQLLAHIIDLDEVYIDANHRAEFRRLLQENQVVSGFESQVRRRDGQIIWISENAGTFYGANGQLLGYESLVQDISVRKQAEAERQRLEEQLLQAQKMKSIGTLAGGVAHDFNNLLTIIIGNVQLTQTELRPDDSLQANLTSVEKAANRAALLTQQLLAFSRRQRLERKAIDLNETISNFMKRLTPTLGEHVQAELRIAPNLPLVFADPTQIEQVMLNLTSNARDAMPDGGHLIIEADQATLSEAYCREHTWAKPGHYIRLSIRDTGSGMDAETQQRIFDPFFTTKEVGQGTGLGLSVVYGIIRQHDGLIDVYSEVGRGTSVGIYLPVGSEALK